MKLYIAIYTDEDITTELAITLRKHGYEARSWREVGMGRRADEEQLSYAAHNGYALMTANIKDFATINRNWLANGKHHSGIIGVPERLKNRKRFSELLYRTLTLLNTITANGMYDCFLYLSNFG